MALRVIGWRCPDHALHSLTTVFRRVEGLVHQEASSVGRDVRSLYSIINISLTPESRAP
jgi:hypothetical protein